MDEKKEAVAQETEAVEENSTQEAVEQTEEQKQEEVQKELIRQLKLKVDGKEEVMDLPFEVDEKQAEWLANKIQPTRAAQKRFQEIAAESKRVNTALQRVQTDPADALKTLGVDPQKFAQQYMEQILKEQDMTEEEKRIAAAERRVAELEAEKQQREAILKKEKEEAEYKAHLKESSAKIAKALESSDLPKSAATQRKMAEYMMMNAQNGLDLPMSSIVELVKEDYLNDIKEMFGSASGEQLIKIFGEDIASKIRKTDLERLKTAPTAVAKPEELNKSSEQVEEDDYISPEEFEAFLNKKTS